MNELEKGSRCPGPFEVKIGEESPLDAAVDSARLNNGEHSSADDDSAPFRRYDCGDYPRCLELAAALNWESFTCHGCSGEMNDTLMWRAAQMARKDSVAKALCGTTKIVALSGTAVKPREAGNS